MKNQYLKYPFITLILCLATASIILLISVLSCRSESTSAPVPQEPSPPIPTLPPKPESTPQTTAIAIPTIYLEKASTNINHTVMVEIMFKNIQTGLSGYDITVSLDHPEIAQIINVILPDFGLTEVIHLSKSSISIRVADLEDRIKQEDTQALLATLELMGAKLGMSEIEPIINAMDDDFGDAIRPEIEIGSIVVN